MWNYKTERVIDWARTCFKCFTVLLTVQTNNEMVMMEMSQSDLNGYLQIKCRRSSMSIAKWIRMVGGVDIYKWSNFCFGWQLCTLEAGPNKPKQSRHKILFYFSSLSLSFTMKWELCQRQSAKGMPTDHSHAHLTTEKKPITACHKKSACVVCPVSKI